MLSVLVERLRKGPLLADGVMGTMLYARGIPLDACFEVLRNEVAGISVPGEVRRQLKDAGRQGLRTGIDLAREILQSVRRRCQGAYLIPSFGRFEVVAEILDALH